MHRLRPLYGEAKSRALPLLLARNVLVEVLVEVPGDDYNPLLSSPKKGRYLYKTIVLTTHKDHYREGNPPENTSCCFCINSLEMQQGKHIYLKIRRNDKQDDCQAKNDDTIHHYMIEPP